jgi:hypothetical protein
MLDLRKKEYRDLPRLMVVSHRPNKDFIGALVIQVWCPFCHKTHNHGLPSAAKLPTHRWAHCADRFLNGRPINSPFKATGYVIVDPQNLIVRADPSMVSVSDTVKPKPVNKPTRSGANPNKSRQ